ncbi:MAG TPA: hypothetical protein PJ988_15820 [Anaerolinea sp.]|nr:hypothetical protein [Anaerolinea sp.]
MKRAIVVGSGAGGATAAKELQGDFAVTVLESGQEFQRLALELSTLERLKRSGLLFDERAIQLIFPTMRIRKTPEMILVKGQGLGGTTTICTGNGLRMDQDLRALGIDLSLAQIEEMLSRLEFQCRIEGETLYAQTPPHRLDIGSGLVGKADLVEEIARLHGYDNLPFTRLADTLPPAEEDPTLWTEERMRDLLVGLGLSEVIPYRMTTPEREKRLWLPGSPEDGAEYVKLANPISPERSYMRRSVLASVMDVMERNSRLTDRLAFFELGPAFLPVPGEQLPEERVSLAIGLSGQGDLPAWDRPAPAAMDFYNLKGVVEGLLDGLHIAEVRYEPAESFTFHPGKCARVYSGDLVLGTFGEVHPTVKARYEFGAEAVLAAEFDLKALLAAIPESYASSSVSPYPPVLEDLAVVVDEEVTAERVAEAIRQGGGKLLAGLRLFDIFRGEQIGAGKKSPAHSLT